MGQAEVYTQLKKTGNWTTSREISQETGIKQVLVSKALHKLHRHKMIQKKEVIIAKTKLGTQWKTNN